MKPAAIKPRPPVRKAGTTRPASAADNKLASDWLAKSRSQLAEMDARIKSMQTRLDAIESKKTQTP